MKMAHKIKMLMIPMILLPFIVTFMAMFVVVQVYLQSVYGSNVRLNDLERISNPIETVNLLIKDQMDILITLYGKNQVEEIDTTQMDAINAKLKTSNAFLLVRKGSAIVYQGNDEVDDALIAELPASADHTGDTVSYITHPDRYIIRQVDFSFQDGDVGSLFVIMYLGNTLPKFKVLTVSMLIVLACIFVIFSMAISIYIHREFVTPIRALQEGTEAIKDGDWEHPVMVDADNELGELCDSFNDMRSQVRESMLMRVDSEEKNKELIANISHDLKTPITAIKGYVEGIMDGVADSPEKMDKYIRIIYNKANEMDAMINELSLYTKLNCNAIPYNFAALSLDAYMDDFMEDMSEREPDKCKIYYENACAPGTRVTADPEQLGRVISNIVTNSRKYCDKDICEIHVRVKPVNDMVEFEFEDNGCGISEEDLPHIFNRTYRADEARRSMGGSGLGLAIAKKVIEEHGGTMWAKSTLSVGTSIFFTLQTAARQDKA